MQRWWTGMAGAALLALPMTAQASDDDAELWFNPTITVALDKDTSFKLDTAQRFRAASEGRVDTYFFRGWLQQKLSDEFTLGGAVEQRFNDGGRDELRLLQQVDGKHGILRTRLRLEQRFSEGRGGRMGLRVRPRAGVALPLGDAGQWAVGSDAELFWTLRGTSPGGDTGITGLRTQVALKYSVSENLELSATYLRQQDFEDSAPDTIGHAPLIGISYSF